MILAEPEDAIEIMRKLTELETEARNVKRVYSHEEWKNNIGIKESMACMSSLAIADDLIQENSE